MSNYMELTMATHKWKPITGLELFQGFMQNNWQFATLHDFLLFLCELEEK